MSLKNKRKGKRGEKDAANTLTELGFPATSNCTEKDVSCPSLEEDGIHIEVKYGYETPTRQLYEFIKQAEHDAARFVKDGIQSPCPIVLHRKPYGEWYAILSLEHLAYYLHLAIPQGTRK